MDLSCGMHKGTRICIAVLWKMLHNRFIWYVYINFFLFSHIFTLSGHLNLLGLGTFQFWSMLWGKGKTKGTYYWIKFLCFVIQKRPCHDDTCSHKNGFKTSVKVLIYRICLLTLVLAFVLVVTFVILWKILCNSVYYFKWLTCF